MTLYIQKCDIHKKKRGEGHVVNRIKNFSLFFLDQILFIELKGWKNGKVDSYVIAVLSYELLM